MIWRISGDVSDGITSAALASLVGVVVPLRAKLTAGGWDTAVVPNQLGQLWRTMENRGRRAKKNESTGRSRNWLGGRDSNPDIRVQSAESYR